VERLSDLTLSGNSLRGHLARGTIINSAFVTGLAALGAIRHFLVAIFLTAADYGLWGLIYVSVATILWLKEVGVSEKYVQQEEPDQEVAFQKAFTLNLLWTGLFCALAMVVMPLFALLYGRPEIIAPGCVMAAAVMGSAFQSPIWVFYRSMRFVHQRTLEAIDPLVGLVVTIGLGIAGAGYWSLVAGVFAGIWSSAIAAVIACPYPLRLRFDRSTLKDYLGFSWPVLVAAGTGVVTIQIAVILGQEVAGLAGVGAIGLAGNIAAFGDRVDQIITSTMYPAICAMRERTDLLVESFIKSNRLVLIWGMPFGLGLALFASDLVDFVLGDKWRVVIVLLQVFGVTTAVKQIGFSWPAFQRAVGETRPLAVYSLVALVAFGVVGVPAMLAWGLTGYAVGVCAITAAQLVVRTYYLKRLFGAFAMVRHSLRALVPSIPAVGAVAAVRQMETGGRTPLLALAELTLFLFVTAAATWASERTLLREMMGYLRRVNAAIPPNTVTSATSDITAPASRGTGL